MPLTAEDLQGALAHALAVYADPKMGQKWLKPVAVLTVDALIPALRMPAGPKPFICMNSMTKDKWRRWVSQKGMKNLAVYPYECLVDLNVMRGDGDPYEILLTAESEGYSGHARQLSGSAWAKSDFMWDLYKLLQVPSPVRLFFTLSSAKYHDILAQRTSELLRAYRGESDSADVWALQFPTASMVNDPVRILHWAPASTQPARADWRFR